MCRFSISVLLVLVLMLAIALPASADLINHWKLDETSGVTADDAQDNQNGTLVNSPTWVPAGGKIDGALDFEADSNQYVTVGDDPLLGSTFTVTAWIKGESFANDDYELIFSQFGGSTGRFFGGVYYGNFMMYQSSSTSGLVQGSALNTGQWYHVAFVKDGADGTAYLDGESDLTLADMTDMEAAPSMIGARVDGTPGKFWDGLIDDVRIYDTALSQSEIQAIIPEPSTLALLATGLIGLLCYAWRKRK